MTAPFLLGGALVFWGWQSNFLITGLVMAAAVESPRWIKARWDFSDADLSRSWAFCSLLLVASALYAFTSNEGQAELQGFVNHPGYFTGRSLGNTTARAAAAWLRWLPMVFFLFAAMQAFSSRDGVPLHTISLILWRQRKKARQLGRKLPAPRKVNVGYPYFALCLFAAGVHGSSDNSYFWGASALVAWALWPRRSRRFAPVIWAASLAAAIAFGFWGQRGLGQLQRYLEGMNPEWLTGFNRGRFDATRSKTSLGQIGRRKASGQIIIRLEATNGVPPPLLRAASYQSYKVQTWYADQWHKGFGSVQEGPAHSWVLLPGKTNEASVNIGCYLDGGSDLLPLPSGCGRLDNLMAFTLAENALGAVMAAGPGLVEFDAQYGPGSTIDSAAADDDLLVPALEKPALDRVISEFQLARKSPEETRSAVGAFFAENFTYQTWQPSHSEANYRSGDTPLRRFLITTRRGHCEFFATATVLLLRELHIRARYAVGFAVHEHSGQKYVVRSSDAHAWCLVWDDAGGTWLDFDTTPGSWVEAEAKRASPLRFMGDMWSRAWYEFSRFRWGQGQVRQYLLWALVPVLLFLLYQIVFRSRRQKRGARESKSEDFAWPGLDSDFYGVASWLAAHGGERRPSEPLSDWLKRAAEGSAARELGSPLNELLGLHYRYRFDPQGLSAAERGELKRKAEACLQGMQRISGDEVRR